MAGQGHGVVWSQPVSPTPVNSPGLPSGHSPGLHGGAWASHGHLQAGGLYGGAGSMVHSQGHATGVHSGGQIPSSWNAMGPMASFGGGGIDSNVAAGTTGTAPLVMPPGLGGPDQPQGHATPMEPLRSSELSSTTTTGHRAVGLAVWGLDHGGHSNAWRCGWIGFVDGGMTS